MPVAAKPRSRKTRAAAFRISSRRACRRRSARGAPAAFEPLFENRTMVRKIYRRARDEVKDEAKDEAPGPGGRHGALVGADPEPPLAPPALGVYIPGGRPAARKKTALDSGGSRCRRLASSALHEAWDS